MAYVYQPYPRWVGNRIAKDADEEDRFLAEDAAPRPEADPTLTQLDPERAEAIVNPAEKPRNKGGRPRKTPVTEPGYKPQLDHDNDGHNGGSLPKAE